MAIYSKVKNSLVIDVIVAKKDFIESLPDSSDYYETDQDVIGGIYYDVETGSPHWNQSLATATLGRKRKNFGYPGMTYSENLDAFIPPTPYPSWELNQETCLWEAPIPRPDDNKQYLWNEAKQEWTYTDYYFEDGELKKEENK